MSHPTGPCDGCCELCKRHVNPRDAAHIGLTGDIWHRHCWNSHQALIKAESAIDVLSALDQYEKGGKS